MKVIQQYPDTMLPVPFVSESFTNPKNAEKWETAFKTKVENSLKSFKYPFPTSNNVLGMEIEIENCEGVMGNGLDLFGVWSAVTDGSLRNFGIEFISRAMPPADLIRAVALVLPYIHRSQLAAEFSWRTSIHVHVNVRDMEVEEFMKFLVLYLIFENSLFKFADDSRKESIFCTPLLSTDKPLEGIVTAWKACFMKKSNININNLRDFWDKYGAVGIFQIHRYGTLEFRHMPGTWDIPKLAGWICLLSQLYESARSLSSQHLMDTITKINTLSHYGAFREQVFGQYAKLLDVPQYEEDIAHGVLRLKEYLFYTPPKNLISKTANGATNLINKLEAREERKKDEERRLRNLSYTTEEGAALPAEFTKPKRKPLRPVFDEIESPSSLSYSQLISPQIMSQSLNINVNEFFTVDDEPSQNENGN